MPIESSLKPKKIEIHSLQVDDELQSTRLASFSRRTIAFALDWVIIILCTEMMALMLPLALIFWLIRGRVKKSLRKGQRLMKRSMLLADRQIASYEIDVKVRRRFTRYMVIYLYILMYLPIVLALGWSVSWLVELINPEQYGAVAERANQIFSSVFQPISSLNTAFDLLIRFLGAFLYFGLFTWQWDGQTPGKRLLHIKAAKISGKPFSFWSSLERATGYTSSAAFLLYGFFQCFWDRNRQTTHDKIAETVVVEA
ncbi:RDD family protein [Tunicatimonas pelagia]|uniref:RDD family protein n=1 Tax=Tunicatimonas pelagia TaxID=931531 RepID=UPI002665885B|nr:RDD family protein [Tunicatimonas pelagia]WKN44750.1 RDD family protein [Tunicatimonas pelagia]